MIFFLLVILVAHHVHAHVQNFADNLYRYKDRVAIPPLGMVDDQICVANCGLDSALATDHLNAQTNIKKLQFGANKCHKLHIGRKCSSCPENSLDTWSLEKPHDNVQSVVELLDVEGKKHVIELVNSDKYLGEICQLLDELCLGDYYFESANILRNSLLLSTILSNAETWYNLTQKEISELEIVDEILLWKIFSAHSKTPKEALYLGSGNVPIRFILMARRVNFLHYIMNEEEESLLNRFFKAQWECFDTKNGCSLSSL